MLWVLILLLLPGLSCQQPDKITPHWSKLNGKIRNAIEALLATAVDTIRASEVDMERMEHIRVNNRYSPAYEMGYLMKTLQENYRMQLEKFVFCRYMGGRLYTAELIIYLVEIEHHFWEADHICNMIHEIERKWGIKGKEVVLGDATSGGHATLPDSVKKILSELSWPSRVKVTEKYLSSVEPPKNVTAHDLMFPSSIKFKPRPGISFRRANRRFQIEAQKLPERPGAGGTGAAPAAAEPAMVADDDKSMKLKLFRLMYEMIRDSDLKVVRAEQIRTHYTNSTSFDIGYLLGDVNDKFNVMTDIRNTVRRLYADWRPIEHINAYEQIANQAIEINHLIDMVNTISKKT